jgi:hypothetical protein
VFAADSQCPWDTRKLTARDVGKRIRRGATCRSINQYEASFRGNGGIGTHYVLRGVHSDGSIRIQLASGGEATLDGVHATGWVLCDEVVAHTRVINEMLQFFENECLFKRSESGWPNACQT